jgi:hypothetical protein
VIEQGVKPLTPNNLLNICKRKLGISTFILPFKDEELLDILYEDTLPTFSKFYPRYCVLKMDLNELQLDDTTVNVLPNTVMGRRAYHLDLERFGSDIVIVDIEDVQALSSSLTDFRTYGQGFTNAYDLMAVSFAQAQMQSMAAAPMIFFFDAPDKLVIDEPGVLDRNKVAITFLLMHASDLSTVKPTYKDKLVDLYMIDLKISLWAVLKHMDHIDTTFGQIELKLDGWDGAEGDRKELVADMESNFLAHRRKKIIRT